VVISVLLRATGFAAGAVARGSTEPIPLLYAIPLSGVVFGFYGMARDRPLRMPRFLERAWDRIARFVASAARALPISLAEGKR
jgi:hypothetical protein